MSNERHALVERQFGPNARAYVESADHARGADLEGLASLVRGRGAARVLDLGCGGGHVAFTVAPHVGSVVAYDLAAAMLEAVRAEARTRGLANIVTERVPFEDASFDIVVTRYSAHHWADLAAGLAGMRRVLKPEGLAVVIDTVAPGVPALDAFLDEVERLRDPSHGRNRSPAEWEQALRRAGLRPLPPVPSRLRLGFAGWIARIGTPAAQARAIRALQAGTSPEVREHFAIEPDGSWTIDTLTIECLRSAA
jgi:SAM-dependent methyltransferase